MNKPTLEDKQKLAQNQGNAYQSALDTMKQMDPHSSSETEDYIVTLAVEKAEGMYKVQPEGDLQWEIPLEHENAHLEIVVQDKEDLRFIPELSIHLSLKAEQGNEVVSKDLPFLWHPFLYHYGADVHIPENGEYTATVTIAQPQFGRHDEDKGKRYIKTVTVQLPKVTIETGRKEYGPE